MLKRIGLANLAILISFFILAVLITYPLIFNLSNSTVGYGDDLFIAWTHNWNIYNFVSGNFLNIFNANIFFPYSNTLAYSDLYFTNSVLAIIPVLILKSPIVANNFTIILSLTLVGFFSYLLTKQIIQNKLLSFLAGVLIIFCPTFLGQFDHIQVISVYFVPLAIYFLLRFLKEKKEIFYIGFLAFLVLQTYNSFLPGYFIIFSSISILIFFLLDKKNNIKTLLTRQNVLYSLLALFLIALVSIPYFKVSKEFNYVRDIRETIHFALQPEDFLVSSDQSRLQGLLSGLDFTKDLKGLAEVKPAYLGIVFSILSLISIFYFAKNFKKQNYIVKGVFAVSILGLILSFGPFLHFQRQTIHNPFPIPLPYIFFYYLVPGLAGIRNSARFEFLFILFMAPLITLMLKEKIKDNKILTIVLLIALVVLEFNFPFKYLPIPQPKDFPKVYSYLSTTPKSTVIIEMPIYNWNVSPYSGQEFWREYYSTENFRKTVNGASGFSPPPWQNFVLSLLKDFPSDKTIAELKKTGVNLIIVHKEEFDRMNKDYYKLQGKQIPSGDEVEYFLSNSKEVELVKSFGEDLVYKIK